MFPLYGKAFFCHNRTMGNKMERFMRSLQENKEK